MSEKKVIIAGGGKGLRHYMLKFGADRIAYVYDSKCNVKMIEGIPATNDLDLVERMFTTKWGGIGDIIISANSKQSQFELAYEFEKRGIPFKLLYDEIDEDCIHISGIFPEIKVDYFGFDQFCSFEHSLEYDARKVIVDFYKFMLSRYMDKFIDEKLDIYLFFNDKPYEAYRLAVRHNIKHIFSFCTTFAIKDRVIPIPDYRSCYSEKEYIYEETQTKCLEAARKNWSDNRAFFAGSLVNAPEDLRYYLKYISEKHSNLIKVVDYSYWFKRTGTDEGYVPMLEQVRYKYLIDIRGNGWADRTKILLQLGRPVLMVDRLFYDWFFDFLEPMRHYVPIKQDMSDLVEKINYLEKNPEKYKDIVENTRDFSERYLTSNAYLEYLRDVTLKYGVIK